MFKHGNAKYVLITAPKRSLCWTGEGRPPQIKSREAKKWIHEIWSGIHKVVM